MSGINRWSLAISLVLAIILGLAAWESHKIYNEKIRAQQAELVKLERWSRSYQRLLPVIDRWNETFRTAADIRDRYTLFQSLQLERYGLDSSPDRFRVRTLEDVKAPNGRALGLARICVSTQGGGGFRVHAETLDPDLLEGVSEIVSRPDVDVSGVRFIQQGGEVYAVMDGFCIYLRS